MLRSFRSVVGGAAVAIGVTLALSGCVVTVAGGGDGPIVEGARATDVVLGLALPGDDHPDGGVVFLNHVQEGAIYAKILHRRPDGTLHIVFERDVALATPAVGADGSIYTAINDSSASEFPTIIRIDSAGAVHELLEFDGGDNEFSDVVELEVSPSGDVYFLAYVHGDGRIFRIDDGQAVDTMARNRVARFAVGPDELVYTADWHQHRVRRWMPDGSDVGVAGNGQVGFSGDGGPTTSAQLSHPNDVDFSSDGSLLIADSGNLRIRRVATNGFIKTAAGTGAPAAQDPGTAFRFDLTDPQGVIAAGVGRGFWVTEGALWQGVPNLPSNRLAKVTPLE